MNERILLDNYAFGIGKINEILSDVWYQITLEWYVKFCLTLLSLQ